MEERLRAWIRTYAGDEPMTFMKINCALRKLVSLQAIALASLSAGIAGAQTIAITDAKVYPVSSEPIENGTVLIRDGKIVAVGSNVTIPSGAQRIDDAGKWVTPGLINAGTQLVLVEIVQVADTRQGSARGHDNVAA